MAQKITVKNKSIDALIPYARNARTHSDEQVAQIAASIREFGFLVPVLVDADNGIIAGHGRVLAARKLGMDTVPTIEAAHLSETQKRAFVIADNKLTLNAGWRDELLGLELRELDKVGFDLELTGFDLSDLAGLTDEVIGVDDVVDRGDRSGASPWSRIESSDTVRAVIGDIEFSLSSETYNRLLESVQSQMDSGVSGRQAARELLEHALRDC